METKKLIKKIKITAEMELLTGLRVGDSKENVEIGGVDAPVVRRKDNNQPYIPGSSLKGKMRCLLEQVAGENADGKCRQTGSLICQLFGAADKEVEQDGKKRTLDGNPSRIIVRDAYLTPESESKLKNSDYTDMPYTEIKAENAIDRVKGTALSPRFIERIPAGTKFNVEFIINLFECNSKNDDENSLIGTFKKGITLIENDYLGGSGSRGYGQVKFHNFKEEEITL